MGMQELMAIYKTFHDFLNNFVKQFPSHLNSDAPEGLANSVDVLPTMLALTDPLFVDGKVKKLQEKFDSLQQILGFLLDKSFPIVKKESHSWFDAERSKLQSQVDTISTTMERLALNRHDVVPTSSGIGGINTGVRPSSDFNASKLEKLKHAFESLELREENSTRKRREENSTIQL
ncbi:uncharacterized protein LOC106013496 [Aplysia californica]|uniref:Uncharacterized protein LOC106013496 n=1 Tax=Aplysia californica TaxID=6500 RepID=A0ABM1AC25_APLCA|nr:uncharacterized protein LOC106013496 [Aplysia californica]